MKTVGRAESNDALREAGAIQREAASTGFDWPEIAPVFDKIREELDEVCEAVQAGDAEQARRELGDLLFAVVNLSRFLDADPASELAGTTDRFRERFSRMRSELEGSGRVLEDCTLAEMDAVWDRMKAAE